MPSLDQFESYYAADNDAVKTAVQSGLVTPDTNVVLHFYRFQPEARDELFGALEKLGDRVWLPHQVGLEFHRNRLTVMHEQENYFSKTRGEIDATIKTLYGQLRAFGRRIGVREDRIENISAGIDMLHTNLTEEIAKSEKANEVRLDGHGSDEVLPRIHGLFRDRVGGPMEPGELEEALREAVRRVAERIPPGYKDNDNWSIVVPLLSGVDLRIVSGVGQRVSAGLSALKEMQVRARVRTAQAGRLGHLPYGSCRCRSC